MPDQTQMPEYRRIVVSHRLRSLEAKIQDLEQEIKLRNDLLINLVWQQSEYIIEDAALQRLQH